MKQKIENPKNLHRAPSGINHVPSQGEKKIFNFLTDIGVTFTVEKQFPGMDSPISGDALRLDFYCKDFRLAIEFDGSQHFKCVKGEPEAKLYNRQLNDRTKDLFCLRRKITLLRIHYRYSDNFKEQILDAIRKTGIIAPGTPT